MKESSIFAIIRAIDPDNAPYIIQDSEIVRHFQRAAEYLKNGNRKLAGFYFRGAKEKVAQFGEYYLTPASVRVGDGVTVNLWSDRYAATVTKVTKSTVTVRRDKATLNPDFKPEWIPGGFAAHCTNQDEQTYTYESDENGTEYTFRWSRKYQRYGQPGNLSLSKGRHEFYDYNF